MGGESFLSSLRLLCNIYSLFFLNEVEVNRVRKVNLQFALVSCTFVISSLARGCCKNDLCTKVSSPPQEGTA